MTADDEAEKYLRQIEIFNPLDYNYGINIIGCGGIGSALGVTLSKLGMVKFILWDNDKIENHNMPNQLFMEGYLGDYKAKQLSNSIQSYNINAKGAIMNIFVDKDTLLSYPIVMVCTDNIKSRKAIYESAVKSGCRLLIDGRMNAKIFRVFTVNLLNKKDRKKYEKTFHKDAVQSCTNRAVIFNIFGIASVMASQLVKVFKREKYPFEINFDYENYVITKH